MIHRPKEGEHLPFYDRYVARVKGDDLLSALRQPGLADLARGVDPSLAGHRYAPGKWSLAQSVQHVIDVERVFSGRALWIARGHDAPLPGMDQDAFAAETTDRPLASLADELDTVRVSTLALFESFSDEALLRMGTASGGALSVRAAGWIIAGHERHHVHVAREHYLASG